MNNSKFSPKHSSSILRSHPFYRRLSFWILVLLVVLVASFFRHKAWVPHERGRSHPPIMLASTRLADIPIYISALGTVRPTFSVTIRTQVNGTLIKILFREGQLVKRGELLAEIDPRPYLAQLTQYEGQIARDRAQLANAKIDLKRYQKLWKQDSVAQQTLSNQEALVKQLEGTVKIDQGLLEATKINLAYTKITSPIAGRIGLKFIDSGNFVQTSDTNGIAIVNMINPIRVVFSIPEDHISEIMQKIFSGNEFLVESYDKQQNKLLATGKLLAVDNQIDPTTGTIRLKAQFQNENNILFPNQFVNVRLLVKTLHNVIVVPTAAIQNSPKGSFVYVLNKNKSTVKIMPITMGVTIGETTEIRSGLSLGQLVVTGGTDKLTDGATVTLPNNSYSKLTTQATDQKNME